MCAAPATENPTTNGAGPEAPKVKYFDHFHFISFLRKDKSNNTFI